MLMKYVIFTIQHGLVSNLLFESLLVARLNSVCINTISTEFIDHSTVITFTVLSLNLNDSPALQ
jgi:hypothetical protein